MLRPHSWASLNSPSSTQLKHTSFQVRTLLARRAASTACWYWCSLTRVEARRPQLEVWAKSRRAAS